MQLAKTCILLIFSLLLVNSCSNRTSKREAEKEVVSPALNEAETFIKSRGSRNNDIVESLYNEILAKNVPLQQLDAEIVAINAKNNEYGNTPFQPINDYNQKSLTYYNTAENAVNQIQDSLLRKKLLGILENSKESAAQKIKEHTNIISQIHENQRNIQNQHLAMKVLLTLPIIEKYQDVNIPDKKELLILNEQQRKLLLKIQNAIKE